MTSRASLLRGAAILWLWLWLLGAGPIPPWATYSRSADDPSVLLPDPAVTPGALRPGTRAEFCVPGAASEARHTSKVTRRNAYRLYGVTVPSTLATKGETPPTGSQRKACVRGCEVDHLVPLALGGADVPENLWPQPYGPRPAAHEKDRLEFFLWREVCAGRMPLGQAQHCLRENWFTCWLEHGEP